MSWFDKAAAVYDRELCPRSFEEDLLLHLNYGYVISTPESFLMGRAVNKDAPAHLIKFPGYNEFETLNAWLVYLAAGDLREFFRHIPFYLPFIGWERRNLLRFYPTEILRQRICGSEQRGRMNCMEAYPVHRTHPIPIPDYAEKMAKLVVEAYRFDAPAGFDPQCKGYSAGDPPPPPAPPAPTTAAQNQALRLRMERLRKARGYESTILTSAGGAPGLQSSGTLLSRILGG